MKTSQKNMGQCRLSYKNFKKNPLNSQRAKEHIKEKVEEEHLIYQALHGIG
jgi:hypothetical protein